MDDVSIFYYELNAASASLQTAQIDLLMENTNLVGDDAGIENPAHRVSLRVELHRRITALHDGVLGRSEEAAQLASHLTAIADRYSDLDLELSGREQS